MYKLIYRKEICMKVNSKSNRMLSFLLAFVMAFSLFSVMTINVSAEDGGDKAKSGDSEQAQTVVTEQDEKQNEKDSLDKGDESSIAEYDAEAAGYASGTGSENDPYIISNAEQLKVLANTVMGGRRTQENILSFQVI